MKIDVELTFQELAALKQYTKLTDDAEAVTKAARAFLRLLQLRELKTVSGKAEYETNWQELEEMERNETDFPQ